MFCCFFEQSNPDMHFFILLHSAGCFVPMPHLSSWLSSFQPKQIEKGNNETESEGFLSRDLCYWPDLEHALLTTWLMRFWHPTPTLDWTVYPISVFHACELRVAAPAGLSSRHSQLRRLWFNDVDLARRFAHILLLKFIFHWIGYPVLWFYISYIRLMHMHSLTF